MTANALAAEILARLAGHDSKRPARADDVAALVGGDERAYWAAIEQLKGSRQINCAHIKRAIDTEPWLGLWPTGLPPGNHSWKALNARGCFAVHHIETPRRLPQSPADRRRTEENAVKSQTRASALDRRDRIAELVKGRPLAEGLVLAEVAQDLGVSVEGVRYLIKDMLGGQRVASGRVAGEHANRLYDPTAAARAADHCGAADEMAAAPAVANRQEILVGSAELPAHAPTAAPATACETACYGLRAIADALGDMEPADDIDITAAAAQVPDLPRAQPQFALWDDGGLSIYDGDELLQIAPADVARLARLLGVPGCQLAQAVAA